MARVSRSKRRAPRQRDAGDLGITRINRPTDLLPPGCLERGLYGGGAVKIQHAILQILFQQPVKCAFERAGRGAANVSSLLLSSGGR